MGEKPVSVCRSRLLPPRRLAPPFLSWTPSATRIPHAPTDLKTNNQNRIKSIKALSFTGSNSNMVLISQSKQCLRTTSHSTREDPQVQSHGGNCPLHADLPSRHFSIIHSAFQDGMVFCDLVPSAVMPRIMLLVQDLSYTGPAAACSLFLLQLVCIWLSRPLLPLVLAQVFPLISCPYRFFIYYFKK